MHLVYWVMKLTNQPFLPEIPYILAKIVLGVCVPNTPCFHNMLIFHHTHTVQNIFTFCD